MFVVFLCARPLSRMLFFGLLVCVAGQAALSHEAWLLTPAEIEALAAEPAPAIFTNRIPLGLAALAAGLITLAAVVVEHHLRPVEARIAPSLSRLGLSAGPFLLRAGLSCMLALAATGGLPRHGTAHWTQPTLLVPDMQLSLLGGSDWLIVAQLVLAGLLCLGAFTRLCGLAVVGLSCLGLALFGMPFLSYAPHFIAPGLLIMLLGGGPVSVDAYVATPDLSKPAASLRQPLWRASLILTGGGFVYLAIAHKLTQPTLLMAILQHGEMPQFGLGYPVLALIMTGVEIICGVLLLIGHVVRPVSLAILGAITFLAIMLGETPLFHANLYATMVLFGLAGRDDPGDRCYRSNLRRVAA